MYMESFTNLYAKKYGNFEGFALHIAYRIHVWNHLPDIYHNFFKPNVGRFVHTWSIWAWYCWWFRNPAKQVRLVVYLPVFKGFLTWKKVVSRSSEPSTVCPIVIGLLWECFWFSDTSSQHFIRVWWICPCFLGLNCVRTDLHKISWKLTLQKKEGFKKQVPSSLAAFLFFSLGPEQGQRHHELKDYTKRFVEMAISLSRNKYTTFLQHIITYSRARESSFDIQELLGLWSEWLTQVWQRRYFVVLWDFKRTLHDSCFPTLALSGKVWL